MASCSMDLPKDTDTPLSNTTLSTNPAADDTSVKSKSTKDNMDEILMQVQLLLEQLKGADQEMRQHNAQLKKQLDDMNQGSNNGHDQNMEGDEATAVASHIIANLEQKIRLLHTNGEESGELPQNSSPSRIIRDLKNTDELKEVSRADASSETQRESSTLGNDGGGSKQKGILNENPQGAKVLSHGGLKDVDEISEESAAQKESAQRGSHDADEASTECAQRAGDNNGEEDSGKGSSHEKNMKMVKFEKIDGDDDDDEEEEEQNTGRKFRDWLWMTIDDPNFNTLAYFNAMIIFFLIIVSTLAFVLETVREWSEVAPWGSIEIVCVSAFAIEYFCRLIVCPTWAYRDVSSYWTWIQPSRTDKHDRIITELFTRARFCLQPMNIVDVLAILPTLIEWVATDALLPTSASALVDLRAIRLTRLLRLLRLIGYSEGRMMHLISNSITRSWRMLRALMFFWAIAVLVFSSIVYYSERGEFFYCSQEAANAGLCPQSEVRDLTGYNGLEECNVWARKKGTLKEKMLQCCYGQEWYANPPIDANGDGCADISKFATIPSTFWFVVVTMTTVGYGDYVPVTDTGKFIATLSAFGGILTLALPTTVISHDFKIVCELLEGRHLDAESVCELLDDKKQEDVIEAVLEHPAMETPLGVLDDSMHDNEHSNSPYNNNNNNNSHISTMEGMHASAGVGGYASSPRGNGIGEEGSQKGLVRANSQLELILSRVGSHRELSRLSSSSHRDLSRVSSSHRELGRINSGRSLVSLGEGKEEIHRDEMSQRTNGTSNSETLIKVDSTFGRTTSVTSNGNGNGSVSTPTRARSAGAINSVAYFMFSDEQELVELDDEADYHDKDRVVDEESEEHKKCTRNTLWYILDDPGFNSLAFWFAVLISMMIFISTVAFVLESVPDFFHDSAWKVIEFICVLAFAIEYISRIIICPTWVYKDHMSYFSWIKPLKHDKDKMVAELLARARFVLQPMNIVDISAILPVIVEWYLATTFHNSSVGALVDLRAIRLTRIFRIFKLMKYVEGNHIITKTLNRSWRMLRSLIFLLLILILVCSSLMYFAERGRMFFCSQRAAELGLCHERDIKDMGRMGFTGLEECSDWANQKARAAHEQKLMCCYGQAWYASPPIDENGDGCIDESRFISIPNTFWFVIATITTVGYGDYVPLTVPGKILSTLTALSGILILALPITVITYNFELVCQKQEEWKNKKKLRSTLASRATEELQKIQVLFPFSGQ